MESRPKVDTAAVYRTVADLLPQEGRDYNLKLATAQDGAQSVVIEGLTPMGKAWIPFLEERLRNPGGGAGAGVISSDGSLQANAETVNSVRKAVVAEYDAKRQARIRDQEKLAAKSRENKDVAAARKAEAEISRLMAVSARVIKIRESLVARAVREAEADRAAGKDLGVDPDAPLTTLFDRTDVDTRLRRAESGIEMMAERSVDIARIGASVVHDLKQYALNKNK